MSGSQQPWSVVIFSSRETLPQLRQTLDAALLASGAGACVHVLVNGNATLAQALASAIAGEHKSGTFPASYSNAQVWSIPFGDKANAWNQFIHEIWRGEEIAFFIDGYVRLNADAIELLGNAVAANPKALGGTGVPTVGRSAAALRHDLITNTGFHGNFCCITGGTIHQMREMQIRLPIGLYRTDGLMGALLSYALDPGTHVWEDSRIHVHPQASWQTEQAKWWRIKDLRAYAKRALRQARGNLEKAAFADHLVNRLCSPAALPATASEMVLEWAARCPDDFKPLVQGRLLVRVAYKSLLKAPDVAPGNLKPLNVSTYTTQP